MSVNSHKNFFFQNYSGNQEQDVLEDLIIESITISGEDILYIPRVINSYDPLYTADTNSSYERAFPLVMYIESFDNFDGNSDFMSKMGLEIRDRVIFSVARKVFQEEVGVITEQSRPNEGDLIYFPLNNKVFQIKYVDNFEMFYPLGKLYIWKMTTELFEYSNEHFSTGIEEIDSIESNSTNILDWNITDEDGNSIITEDLMYLVSETFNTAEQVDLAINDNIQNAADEYVKYSEKHPFAEGFN